MSPTVKEFRFPLANPEKVAYESDSSWGGVRDVRERMGGALEVLGVWAERPVGEVERVLMELFVGDGDGEAIIPRWFSGPEDEAGGPWPKLRTLVLPKHFMTSSLFTTLSGFPALRTIEFRYDTDDHSLPSDSTSFSPSFTKSKPFPVLDDLSFTVPLSSVASLFSTGPEGLLKSLTSLYVHSYEFESPSSFHALLLALSISTPHLKLLALLSSVLPTTAQAQDDQRITQHQQRITYTDLLPIHAQKHLTTLEIIHHLPLRLTLDDIVYMARAFGEGMEVVVLGNEPFGIMQDLDLLGLVDEGEHGDDEGDREGDGEEGDGMHGALTLEAIYAFARFCPNLSKLGLFVDARSVPRFPPMHQDLRPSEALGLESGLTLGGGTGLGGETGGLGRGTGLTPWDTGELGYGFNGDVVLSMGLSPVGDEGEVAMYLSRLACSAASSVGSSSSSSAALGKHNDRQGLGKLAQTPSFYSLTDLNTSVLSLSPSTFSLSPMPITAATRGVFPDPPIEGLRRIGIECGLSVDEALQYTPVTMIPIAGMTMTAVANAFMVMNSNPSTDLRTSTHLRNSAAGWKGVGKMMPLLVKMRWEEEVRNGGLRREVRDLRMRVDVLGGGGGVESRSWGGSKLEEGQQEVGKGKGKEAERKKGKGVPGVGSGADRVRAVGMGLKRRLSSMLF
ncbi:hypothetical protein BDV98DRAFT_575587 [Pterulicium gracile]|uniref:Uncharacterized protein n=1 Tax=Pterulicium gracile TaxID=1884261 RepID=A0A5C3Q8Q1_9AGAR|nr:hypothetical protein BDV98DRAFT_575587 [Pterula gracilis]